MRRVKSIPRFNDLGEPGSPSRRRSLATIGAEAGPQAVAWQFLREAGQRIAADGLQAEAKQVAKDATAKGEAEGGAAFASGAAPTLRDDGTIAGAARDRALMGAYLTRMDLSSEELAGKLASEHAEDPNAFRARWDAAGQALVEKLPPEFREPARMEWARKGLQQLGPIQRAADAKALAEANAELVKGQDGYRIRAANAWRAGDQSAAAEFDMKFRQTVASRTDLDPRKREALLLDYEKDMRRHTVLGDFDRAKGRGLGAAEAYIKHFADPKHHPDFDPDDRDKIATEMTRDLHALKVEHQLAVTALHAEASTAINLAKAGYAVPQLDSLIDRAGRLDPKLAASLSEGKADIVYQSDVAKLPPGQILKDATDWKAKADAATDLKEKARYARRYQAAVESLKATTDALGKDSLIHAARQGQIQLGDFDAANPDPEALKARIAARDKAQGYYGLPMPLLTNPQATNLVKAIATAPPEEMADRMHLLAARYGDKWPEVYAQLVNNKEAKLPPEYRVLAAVDQPVARVKLAEAFQVGKELRKSLPDADAKAIDADIEPRLAPLRASLAHAPDGPKIIAEYAESAKLLAYQYARTLPWEDASSRAVADLVTSRYDFVQDDNHQARAPAGAGEQVKRMAGQILSALKPGDLAPAAAAGSPVSEENRRHAAWIAAKRGRWVTNETDDGWVLLDSVGQPVMRADGARVEMKFTVAGVGR